ncbi:hypothetical protein COW99_03130 [Candidatus Roizmanbacteria bacterium CG22_combo_CG10-13_8_21_14_all_38_20]|uniref:YknX-like C-terminal permuted SH3-like domain-containing protein n=1 Tax=Candidatus Roizmanbacteria bacterium CG22_combo_CG10-13_8_21_14_all_38_20 TaxID=1974862 RepID=A0A2H0BVA6_9BACT|nr:efflux RND transporter periplasmic adaptor subunit [Candidatus Microgenomates bacterium]PIP61616.1 MAG: hypothetical protein COW99_03130 [Candidatus Roizmanbacteria bacterium CG22_combo_CG10-13_8_21_14_all_38_20]PJC30561.1 MAG: hypothetical protein CO050_05610 [Candidatus Roizmanbacteria bacterium CG_4_9_14_0_2_um_filter_38_17]
MYRFIKNHKLTTLILLGVVIVLSYYFFFQTKTKGESVKLGEVSTEKLSEAISASGSVDAAIKAKVRFASSGKLSWVGVQEGDVVKKWQALASLDKEELQKKLEKELIDYKNERWDFEQGREDYGVEKVQDQTYPNVLTDELRRILQKNQFDLDSVVLDVEIQNLAIKYATIISPIDGLVVEIEEPFAGVNTTPAGAEITVVDPKSTEFVAEVDEVDVSKINVGQGAIITLDAYPDEVIKATVKSIDFVSTTTKGGGTAYLVKTTLPENIGVKFRIGMNGDIEFVVEDLKSVLVVPQKSIIITDDNKTSVWVVKDGVAKLIEVELGAETADYAEIISGLKEGEKVATEGQDELKEGKNIE